MLRLVKEGYVGCLLGEQQIARVLDRLGDGALLAGREAGVFTREDFARVGDVTAHQLGSGERKVLRREAVLGGGFGRAAHKSRVGHEVRRRGACQQVCPGAGSWVVGGGVSVASFGAKGKCWWQWKFFIVAERRGITQGVELLGPHSSSG